MDVATDNVAGFQSTQPPTTTAPTIPDAATVPTPNAQPGAPGGAPSSAITGPQATPPKPPKESFIEGVARQASPQYTTDAQGNVMRAEPARAPSVKGVLGGVLMGALKGAAAGAAGQAPEGAKGKGAAFSAGAAASERSAIEADKKARAVAQQNFENKQNVTKEAAQQAMWNAQTVNLAKKTAHDEILLPAELKKAELENTEIGQRVQVFRQQSEQLTRAAQEAEADTFSYLDSIGAKYDTYNHLNAKGAGASSVYAHAAPIIPAVASGQVALTHSGTGDENGAHVFNVADLKNIPLTEDFHYKQYDGTWTKDKNGNLVPHFSDEKVTAKDANGQPTGANAYTAYIKGKSAAASLDRIQNQLSKSLTDAHIQAEAKELNAKASNESAQAELTRKQMAGTVAPTGWMIPSDALTKGPDALAADIKKYGGNVPSHFNELYAVAKYTGDLDAFPTSPRPKTGQISRADAADAIRTYIDPNFHEGEFGAIKSYLKEFEGGKSGDGVARGRLNTAVHHLYLAKQASDLLASDTGRHDMRAWNALSNEMGVQFNAGGDPVVMYRAIADKAAAEAAGAMKGGSGSPTDDDIKVARKAYDENLAPELRNTNFKTQAALIHGAETTLAGRFQDTTKHTPEQLGHQILFGGNQEKLDELMRGGAAQNSAQPSSISYKGQSYPVGKDGTIQIGGYPYKLDSDGKTLVLQQGPVPNAR